jgi:hypothetical protein
VPLGPSPLAPAKSRTLCAPQLTEPAFPSVWRHGSKYGEVLSRRTDVPEKVLAHQIRSIDAQVGHCRALSAYVGVRGLGLVFSSGRSD